MSDSLATRLDDWLREAALPLWATAGFGPPQAGFAEALAADGTPAPLPRRLRVQARQTWVFAQAGLMNWDGPWRERAAAGLEVLHRRYRRPDGAYRTLVAQDGAVLDDGDTLYDQAFVLLAFAAATQAGVADLRGEALALFEGPIGRLRHAAGGFSETRGPTPFQANPNMHLFEAALAWEGVDPDGPWRELADGEARLGLKRFFDGRRLYEFFDESWTRAPGEAGALVDPGHQFEWAWLLSGWARARGREVSDVAARLFAAGEAGVDPARGVAVDMAPAGADPRRQWARLWPQTERLKAALVLGRTQEAEAAGRAIGRYLDASPLRGAHRERLRPDGVFVDEPAPASTVYHLVGAIAALGVATP